MITVAYILRGSANVCVASFNVWEDARNFVRSLVFQRCWWEVCNIDEDFLQPAKVSSKCVRKVVFADEL